MDKKETMRIALSDKMSVLQVLGCLIKNPLLFTHKEYVLRPEDFPERFHRIVFGAINYLALQGMSVISPIDIDQFLTKHEIQYKIFTDNSGIAYIKKCIEVANETKFEYYYTVLKKYSLLNRFYEQGFDISEIIDITSTDPRAISEKQAKFDNMTVADIIDFFESKLLSISQDFNTDTDVVCCDAGAGLRELKEGFKQVPDMGMPLISPKCTTLFRGQRLKKLYMESSIPGGGKSRRAIGEAAHLAIPHFFDTVRNKWIETGLKESVLYISIELEPDEIQTPLIAYVSGVPENKILDGNYTQEEEARVDKAIEYITQANLYIVRISNFNIDDIEGLIKQYKQQHNVRYVFYDYIATSLKIMAESSAKTRMSGLREDQILLMMSARLKDLCNKLNIHIHTATQVNGEWKTARDADQNLLRGAKALADKVDVGCILLPVRDTDEGVINSYLSKGFNVTPNMVIHVYKVRKGKLHNVKLYTYFDYGTCRMQDCFVTDKDGKILDVEDTNIEFLLKETEEKKVTNNIGFEF